MIIEVYKSYSANPYADFFQKTVENTYAFMGYFRISYFMIDSGDAKKRRKNIIFLDTVDFT